MISMRPQLLVSVRSSREAEAAIAGGADIIDVKEPSHGSLGRADSTTLDAIRRAVAGRRLLSAALGELAEFDNAGPDGFDFVKCGLAKLDGDWRLAATRFQHSVRTAKAVVVAYADWQCAQAPPIDDVIDFACSLSQPVLLIDTCCKDQTMHGRRATLTDWMPQPWIAAAIDRLHAAGGRIALAGSLTLDDIDRLRCLDPDWIAVRGAACDGSDRAAEVDAERVRQIKTLLDSPEN